MVVFNFNFYFRTNMYCFSSMRPFNSNCMTFNFNFNSLRNFYRFFSNSLHFNFLLWVYCVHFPPFSTNYGRYFRGLEVRMVKRSGYYRKMACLLVLCSYVPLINIRSKELLRRGFLFLLFCLLKALCL